MSTPSRPVSEQIDEDIRCVRAIWRSRPMYKVAWIARYTKDKTKQEASDYWAGHHGPTMKKVEPVAGYVQSHVVGPLPLVTGVAEEETFFDGYSCAWWNSRGDFEQA